MSVVDSAVHVDPATRHFVLRSVSLTCPALAAHLAVSPDGLKLDEIIDPLIAIAQRSANAKSDSLVVQVLEDICTHCPNSMFSGHCRMRRGGECNLFANIPTVMQTIADALSLCDAARKPTPAGKSE